MRAFEKLPAQFQNDSVKAYYDILSKRQGSIILKRVFDIIVSLILLVFLIIPIAVISILIKVNSPGPVLFKQKRVTTYGRIFKIYKFRTMVVNAESLGSKVTTKNDARVTSIGKTLRKFRLDELPQVLNILKGDMSMVGPRPERPEIAREYEKEIPEFQMRLKVKAGLTGFAQIYGLYNTTPYDKLKLDLTYIRHYSLFQDLKLIFMTPKIMFMKESTEGVKDGQTTASLKEAEALTPSNLKEEVYGKSYVLEEEIEKAEARSAQGGNPGRKKRKKHRR